MPKHHSIFVKPSHAYTSAKADWDISVDTSVGKGTTGWRLFHYLSAGGIAQFGTTCARQVAERRQKRFLIASSILAALWCLFYFI